MTLAHVATRVRDVPGTVDAVRTAESRLLAAFEFLMIGQATLAAEAAGAVDAMKFLIQHLDTRIRLDHRHRCHGHGHFGRRER